MTTANSSYTFSIESTEVRGAHPKTGLATIAVQGVCTDKDGTEFNFVATNNLDKRYADRFKVNWNGSKARMPEVVGHGIGDDVKSGLKVSSGLYFSRGARIAIAKKCRDLFPADYQAQLGAKEAAAEEVDAS